MIFAGQLDQVITIQTLTTGTDGMGATTESWATLSGSPTRAQYIPIRGIERIEANKLEEKISFKLRVRRDASITVSDRVVYNSKNYDIIDIEDNNRDNDMVIWCREAIN